MLVHVCNLIVQIHVLDISYVKSYFFMTQDNTFCLIFFLPFTPGKYLAQSYTCICPDTFLVFFFQKEYMFKEINCLLYMYTCVRVIHLNFHGIPCSAR